MILYTVKPFLTSAWSRLAGRKWSIVWRRGWTRTGLTARHVRAMMKEGYYSRRRGGRHVADVEEATVTEY